MRRSALSQVPLNVPQVRGNRAGIFVGTPAPFDMVLALDIDGVLQTPAILGWERMEHADAVECLLDEYPTLALLLVSPEAQDLEVESVRALLPEGLAERVMGSTKTLVSSRAEGKRQLEIEEWLSRHPSIKRWVAVDDETELFSPECKWLVATSKWFGWTEHTSAEVRELLA